MRTSLYVLGFVMMFPVLAVVVLLLHTWWKRTKEAHHGKRHGTYGTDPRTFLR